MIDEKAEAIMKRAETAFEVQQQHIGVWTEAAKYCLDRKIYVRNAGGQIRPWSPNPDLQNTTAVNALNQMAAGMQSAFMSSGEAWFTWEPSDWLPTPSEEYVEWLIAATKKTLLLLPQAGFYDAAGEMIRDAGCMGTSVMFIEGDKDGSEAPINCETYDIGSYAIQQNSSGLVDHVWREFCYTVDVAERKYPGYKGETWKKLTPEQKMRKEATFIVEICPRDAYERDQTKGAQGMPVRMTVIHKEEKRVVEEGGFEEMPALAYRFRRQSGINPWGVAPGIDAIPDCRGVNWMDSVISDGAGKMVDPPVALKSDIRGPVDLRMSGTVIVDNMADAPKAIFEVGNMQTAEAFLEKKQRQLRMHFFADLFAFFMDDRSYKTAAEVHAIKAEKLDLFGPLGHHFLNEWVDRALERIFMILFRQGFFGDPPADAFVRVPGGVRFLYPKAVQQSRMALLLRQQGNAEIRQLLVDIQPLASIDPSILNNFNFNTIARRLASSSVYMHGITRSPEEAAMLTAAQQQAAQQQQQMEWLANFATKNPDHAAQLAALAGQAQAA